MKALLVALLLVGVVPAAAQTDTYVKLQTYPDFEYRSDEEVSVSFRAQRVANNIPTDDLVRITVQSRTGQAFPVLNGQDLALGVRASPVVNQIRLGHLEAGLYELKVTAASGSQTKQFSLDISVVLPPVAYAADLKPGPGKDGTFFFTPRDPTANRTFTIEVYTESGGGRQVLDRVTTWNATRIRVPFMPQQPVKIDVTDPNGWTNREHDVVIAGAVVKGLAWEHHPDYCRAEACQDHRIWAYLPGVAVAALLVVGVALLWWRLHGGSRE